MRRMLIRLGASAFIVGAAMGVGPDECRGGNCNKCGHDCTTPALQTCDPVGNQNWKCVCTSGSCETDKTGCAPQ